MSDTATIEKAEAQEEVLPEVLSEVLPSVEKFDFQPPPALKAALSTVWAAYDAVQAAGLEGEVVQMLDECIHLVLDEIDNLEIDELKKAGLLNLEDAVPWGQVKAEMGWDDAEPAS